MCLFLPSVPHSGSDSHAGGAGDLLRAAAAEAAEEDVLPEKGEAARPPQHSGARPTLLHHRVQKSQCLLCGQNPSVCQRHHSGVSQQRPHD